MTGAEHAPPLGPLAGRRVVVTRAADQAAELIQQLAGLGAEVILLPMVDFVPLEDFSAIDALIRELAGFDWLLFTSQNAVRFFAERCRSLGIDLERLLPVQPRVAAVGPATAEAARSAGFVVARIAQAHHAAGLVEELHGELAGKRILLPRSDRARGDLPAALRRAGAEVVEVMAYRTISPASPSTSASHRATDAMERVLQGEVDVIIFASPSAFHHFAEHAGAELLRALSQRVALAAIGPVTTAALREAGLRVSIEARQPGPAGLAGAIVDYYSKSRQGKVAQP